MVYKPWIVMCDQQVEDTFTWLNSKLETDYFVGDSLTRADVSVAIFWQFGMEKRRKFFERMNCTAIQSLSDRLSMLDAFKDTPPDGPLPVGLTLGL
jgi:glutathione S-transferase